MGTSEKRIRIGLVGTGDIGYIQGRAFSRQSDVDIVVCRGRNPKRAENLAQELECALADGYEELLADSSVEAVVLCVPNHLHREYAVAAARAGKHILCEKPIALTKNDAAAMIDAARAARVKFAVAHVVRFGVEHQKAREVIQSGTLGKVRAFSAWRMVPVVAGVAGADGWRHDAERSGGAVIDLLIHDTDFLLWTFGLPEMAQASGVKSHTGGYEHVSALFHYPDGPSVSVESSFLFIGDGVRMGFRAIGDEGTLEYTYAPSGFAMHDIPGKKASDHPAGTLTLYRWSKDPEVLSTVPTDAGPAAFESQARAFVDLLRGTGSGSKRGVELASADDASLALQMALAVREACASNQPIKLADVR